MGSGNSRSSKQVLSSKREASEGLTKEEFERLKQEKEAKIKLEKSYFPPYFDELLSRVEILRANNHSNPEKYVLPKLFKLSNTCERIRRNDILERHMLESTFTSLINSDKDSIKKKQKYYNNLINRFRE